MKTEKIYDFPVDRPLTPAKRKALERHIDNHAQIFSQPVTYRWDGDDVQVLNISAEPVQIEVRFQDKNVELYAAAPIWARLLFTQQKKIELKEQIQSILLETKFVLPKKPTRPVTKTNKRVAKGSNLPATKRRKRSTV